MTVLLVSHTKLHVVEAVHITLSSINCSCTFLPNILFRYHFSLRSSQWNREAATEEPSCPKSPMLPSYSGRPYASFQQHGCGNTHVPETRCVVMTFEQEMVYKKYNLSYTVFFHFLFFSLHFSSLRIWSEIVFCSGLSGQVSITFRSKTHRLKAVTFQQSAHLDFEHPAHIWQLTHNYYSKYSRPYCSNYDGSKGDNHVTLL